MKPDMELMSKAQVMREYNYPKEQLDKDLAGKHLKHFRADDHPQYPTGVYYIPRAAVEQRLRELCGMTEG